MFFGGRTTLEEGEGLEFDKSIGPSTFSNALLRAHTFQPAWGLYVGPVKMAGHCS